MNRNEIISILNYAVQILPEDNEVTDGMQDIIHQLEEEWADEFEEDEWNL